MQLLTNYAPCFYDEADNTQQFQPYSDEGALKIICTTCGNEAVIETNGAEKRFACTCYSGVKFSCSFVFYDEMVAAASVE